MKKLAIIGGGASGVLAAINLKKHLNIDVWIFERQNRILKKVLQTGNGMCNITNKDFSDVNNLVDVYNHNEILDIFKEFSLDHCVDFFNDLGLLLKSDDVGRYYPYSKKATNVCDILLRNVNDLGIHVELNKSIENIEKTNVFKLTDNNKQTYEFDYCIVSCGGKSQIQFENNTYDVLKKLGHTIIPQRPGLIGFKLKENVKSLSGIKLKCDVKLIQDNKEYKEYNGEVTFKDDGISGIILLDISRFYKEGKALLSFDLMSDYSEEEIINILKEYTKNVGIEEALLGIVPKMIAKDICDRSNNISDIAHTLKNYTFNVKETYPFSFSQITKGGVSIDDVKLSSFESKKVSDLYITGEVLDVDGKCGGYNLHFAWTTGYLASKDIINKEK